MTSEQAFATAFSQAFMDSREAALGSMMLTAVILAGGLRDNSELAVDSLTRLLTRAKGDTQ